MRSGDTVLGSIWWDRLRYVCGPVLRAQLSSQWMGTMGTHTQEFLFLDVAVLPLGKYRQSCLIGSACSIYFYYTVLVCGVSRKGSSSFSYDFLPVRTFSPHGRRP